MSQQLVDHYVRWLIRHVRDKTLNTLSNQFRQGYVTDPNDPLYRGPYHRLLRAGVPEATLPAVLDLIIQAVDAALETAVWQADHLRTTGHLRVSLLESAADGNRPARWVELSPQHLTYERFCPWIEQFAEIRNASDLDALVRAGHAQAGIAWEDPVPAPTTRPLQERIPDDEADAR